ncbi:uncharacterized protein LOC143297323 [Babylonia areolata]|uniref:uncharacterized protein LOC143297323 n=1 Tax=Babylonia areolata TaxID=304850 RepID=UPI003FCF6A38
MIQFSSNTQLACTMERQSNRAFTFCFVVFTLFLIVSSATDDQSKSDEHNTVDNSVASVSKVDGNVNGERTEGVQGNVTSVKKPDAASESFGKNCTTPDKNDTDCKADNKSLVTKLLDNLSQNREMLWRAIFVLLGVTGIVVIFYIIKAVGLRRRRNKSRKYGVITTRGDLEMEPLGQGEDEDEDYTVFEMNGRAK